MLVSINRIPRIVGSYVAFLADVHKYVGLALQKTICCSEVGGFGGEMFKGCGSKF